MARNFEVKKSPRSGEWSASVVIDLDAIPSELSGALFEHGVKQKIADAASGAKTSQDAIAAMEKARDALLRGEWNVRGEGLSDESQACRNLLVRQLDASGDTKTLKEFRKLSYSDQCRKAAEYGEQAFTPDAIAAEVRRMADEAERRAKEKAELAAAAKALAPKVKFTL